MKYHEIGERFEYNGVVLEVIHVPFCSRCYFHGNSICKLVDMPKYCSTDSRNDNKSISYKLVEQCKPKDMEQKTEIKVDNVNHPAHYNSHPSGIECIEIARHHNFNIGNAIKYLWRAGLKSEKGMEDADKQVEDLRKAIFYINDEIERIKIDILPPLKRVGFLDASV